MVLCGAGRSGFNYGLHSDDLTVQKPLNQNPHGGGMSTVTFSLKVLYDQYQRFLNKWSYPNDQLDLARYKGCKFTFYRHPDTDFVVQYDNVPPMKMDEFTAPNTHPNLLLQAKHRRKIPSFKTRPFGKKTITIRVGPPKLFEDKWYPQSDLCKVPLVSWRVTAADLRFPFCSPQTDNPCFTFQVLHEEYYNVLGTSVLDQQTNNAQQITKFEKWLYEKCTHYQTFATDTRLAPEKSTSPSGEQNWSTTWTQNDFTRFKKQTDSNYGYCTYCPTDHLAQKIKQYRNNRFNWLTTPSSTNQCHINMTYSKGKYEEYEYHLGWYSNIFIGNLRHNLAFSPAYIDVTYNPIVDKGLGNHIWFQYLTKPTTELIEAQAKCHIQDLPLYAMTFGYEDYLQRTLGPFQDVETVGIICFICPYTEPPCLNKNQGKKNWGYVFYDTNFGNGKTPEGLGQVHPYWMQRWRPVSQVQKETLNRISRTGPFSYRDEHPSVTLTANYKFYFNWGGDSIFHRLLKTPVQTTACVPTAIESLAQYKSLARSQWDRNTSFTPGTGDGVSLMQKLSKECLKNQMMMQSIQQVQKSLDGYPLSSTKGKKTTSIRRRRSPSPRKKKPLKKSSKKSRRRRYSSTSSSSTESSDASESNSNSSCCNSPRRKAICT